jgi:hypothetical protein
MARGFGALALLLAGMISACGDDPGGPTPTPGRLEIVSAPEVLLVGHQHHLAAAMVFPDGSSTPVTAVWSILHPFAQVETSGVLTGVSNGETQLQAAFAGQVAVRPVRVAPDYAGAWNGTATITSCGRDASFPVVTFCSSAAAAPAQPLRLQLTQTGLATAGDLTFAGGFGAVTGTVAADGSLSLQGVLTAVSGGATFAIAVASWRSTLSASAMNGTFQTIWSTAGTDGRGYLEAGFTVSR